MLEASARIFTSTSLRVRIGVLYSVLALCNIVFFSIMIFENQTDLLNEKFKLQSEKVANRLTADLNRIKSPPGVDANHEAVERLLREYHVQQYIIFDGDGLVLGGRGYNTGRGTEKRLLTADGKKVSENLRLKSLEVGRGDALFRLRYHVALQPDDFRTEFILPLHGGKTFLYTTVGLEDIQGRLRKLYFQIALAVIWGVVFHVLFAVFIARVFLGRIESLTGASKRMAGGDLSARADWKFSRGDELDVLGRGFNDMAGRVETTIETIRTLNEDIQYELEVGREVQVRFLPDEAAMAAYQADCKPAIHYRPLREVSGDIYTFYQDPDGPRSVFLADATGHGVPAALITGIAMMALDGILPKNLEPDMTFDYLNNVLTERLSPQFYITGSLARIQPDGLVECVNAGHPPPFVYNPAARELTELKPHDPPLGIVVDYHYSVVKHQTRPGDRLIMYSDALYESENDEGNPFTLDRVREIIKTHGPEASNATILADLVGQLDRHTEKYMDDLTVIVLEL